MALGRGSYEIMVAADDTEDGEMASALLGGVGVLVVNVVVVEMEAAG
jgi:hypothetical protein